MMEQLQMLKRFLFLTVAMMCLTACGQKGPLILPPKNTSPQVVTPIILPEERLDDKASSNQALDEDLQGDNFTLEDDTSSKEDNSYRPIERESDEIPLGILSNTARKLPAEPK